MPRLKALIHPYYGRLPVNADGPCPSCGAHGVPCYLICPFSPACQTYEEERADALATEAEIAAVGFMAWDSAQHRAHGLPCPYDGYDDGWTLAYEAEMDDPPVATVVPHCETCGQDTPWPVQRCDKCPPRYVPDPPAWPDDDDLPF